MTKCLCVCIKDLKIFIEFIEVFGTVQNEFSPIGNCFLFLLICFEKLIVHFFIFRVNHFLFLTASSKRKGWDKRKGRWRLGSGIPCSCSFSIVAVQFSYWWCARGGADYWFPGVLPPKCKLLQLYTHTVGDSRPSLYTFLNSEAENLGLRKNEVCAPKTLLSYCIRELLWNGAPPN